MTDTPLTIDQLASTMACLAFFESRGMDAVLDQLRVEQNVFRVARDHWLEVMSGEFDDDDAPIATQFGDAMKTKRAELEAQRPELADVPPILDAPAVGDDFEAVDVTSPHGIAALGDQVLPFEGGRNKPPLVKIEVSDTHIDAGETQFMEALDIPDGALPFAETPELSLSQYASLRAELSCRPADKDAILARYNVSNDEQHDALNEHYEARFADHPTERVQFEQLVATYTVWLSGTGKPR